MSDLTIFGGDVWAIHSGEALTVEDNATVVSKTLSTLSNVQVLVLTT